MINGVLVGLPNEYSQFGRVKDPSGNSYTVEKSQIPEDASEGDEVAYRVEIWGNDSGVAYDLKED